MPWALPLACLSLRTVDNTQPDISEKGEGIRGFAKACVAEARRNVSISRRNLIFDAAVLFACFLLFEGNNLVLKPLCASYAQSGMVGYLIQCHLNDFIGGVAFLAYVNLLLDLVKPDVRFRKLAPSLIFIFCCGLFWEVVAPTFVPGSTGDVLDLIAYVVGAAAYVVLNRALGSRDSKPLGS